MQKMPFLPLKLAREVEADFGEVGLGHLEDIVAVCEEDVAAVFVFCHELVFALFEGLECYRVVAFNPTCFV